MELQQSAILLLTIIVCALQFARAISDSPDGDTDCIFVGCKCTTNTARNVQNIDCGMLNLSEFPLRNSAYSPPPPPDIEWLVLDLDDNHLTRVSAGLLQNLFIAYLFLRYNKIEILHNDSFTNVKAVGGLYMYSNDLRQISAEALEPLRSTAERLDFKRNNLTMIEAFTFANFTKVELIDLSNK